MHSVCDTWHVVTGSSSRHFLQRWHLQCPARCRSGLSLHATDAHGATGTCCNAGLEDLSTVHGYWARARWLQVAAVPQLTQVDGSTGIRLVPADRMAP
jgi:hypothetical protein